MRDAVTAVVSTWQRTLHKCSLEERRGRAMVDQIRHGIRIIDRSTFKEIGSRIEIEWQLDERPDLEWAEIFQMAAVADRRGTLEWVNGGDPDVLGTVIRWFVPTAHIDDADAEVHYRVAVANKRREDDIGRRLTKQNSSEVSRPATVSPVHTAVGGTLTVRRHQTSSEGAAGGASSCADDGTCVGECRRERAWRCRCADLC